MKTILRICVLIFLSGTAFSQTSGDKKLLLKYSETELAKLKENSNQQYEFELYALKNAISFAQTSAEKTSGLQSIEQPSKDATYLDLGLEIKDQNQYFKINGSDKLLVIKSKWVLTNEMKTK